MQHFKQTLSQEQYVYLVKIIIVLSRACKPNNIHWKSFSLSPFRGFLTSCQTLNLQQAPTVLRSGYSLTGHRGDGWYSRDSTLRWSPAPETLKGLFHGWVLWGPLWWDSLYSGSLRGNNIKKFQVWGFFASSVPLKMSWTGISFNIFISHNIPYFLIYILDLT